MIGQAFQWTRTPYTTPLHPKKWNPHFCITFNFWCWPDWSMDSNPIHHPSPANKMKCFFFDYVQLLMISQAGWWTQTPSATPLQPIEMKCFIFGLCSTSRWLAGLVDGLEPHPPPLSSQKTKCSFLDYVQLLMISQAVRWTQTPSATPLQPIKWNAHFWITFNFWWSAGLVNGLEPHPPPVSSQKMKCSYFDYVQLLMIGRLVNGLKPHPPPLSTKKMKCSFLDYIQLLMLARLVNGLKPHPPPLSSQ